MSEEDGAKLLGPLRTVDAPASDGVSVERAIRSGKRTKSLRVAAVAVFVLIAVGVVPLALQRVDDPVAVESFDVFRRTVKAGNAGGYRQTGFETWRDREIILLGPEKEPVKAWGTVTVFAAGRATVPTGESVPDVNGRRAVWTPDEELAWEWADGAWAFVDIAGFDHPKDRAHHVAESVAFGQNMPVTVPFTMQAPPWELVGVRAEGDKSAELVFDNGVRVGLSNNSPLAHGGNLPRAEAEALEQSVRPVDPPVTNPFR